MPEIVEVELQKEGLQRLIGQKIENVEFFEKGDRIIRPYTENEFYTLVSGKEILSVDRIGKYITIKLGNNLFG